jgi:hypothetical protein
MTVIPDPHPLLEVRELQMHFPVTKGSSSTEKSVR